MSSENEFEPTLLVAGDYATWRRKLSDYKASDGWALTYDLIGSASLDITTTADGDDHIAEVTAAESATLNTNTDNSQELYRLVGRVTKGSEVYTVFIGDVFVNPDPTNVAAGTDFRSHARKTLDAIEAVIESRATKDQQSYAINGRSLNRIPIEELLTLRDRYRSEVVSEERNEKAKRGEPTHSRVLVKF